MGLIVGSLQLSDAKAVRDAINDHRAVTIEPCFGLKSEAIPVQTNQGPGVTMFRQAMPLANLQGPAKLHTLITGALLFSEMEETEQRRHKGLVEQLMTQLSAARAEAAGIKLATPGDMPGGRHS